jgi:hypothetical protein
VSGWVKLRKAEKLGESSVWAITGLRYGVSYCDKRLGERLSVG